MAKNNKELEERMPLGKDIPEGYNEPVLAISAMAVTPELQKGNLKTTGKNKNGKSLQGISRNIIRSDELAEGMTILAEDNTDTKNKETR